MDRTLRILDLMKKEEVKTFSSETITNFIKVFDEHEKKSLNYTHISLINSGYQDWDSLTEAVWNEKHNFGMKFEHIYEY